MSKTGFWCQKPNPAVAMEKVAEQNILTKCSKCNTFQVISNLVHHFMNFNALKIFKNFIKKNKKNAGLILTQVNLLVAKYICAR